MRFLSIFFIHHLALFSTATSMSTSHRLPCDHPSLSVHTYHTPLLPITYQNTSPLWSPTAFTLISSPYSSVLVDVPPLAAEATQLASWIKSIAPNTSLEYIYITHAHFDHFGAFPVLLAEFPDAKVVATRGVRDSMPGQYAEPLWSAFWLGLFPDVEKADVGLVNVLSDSNLFTIDDGTVEFRGIPVIGGDTVDSTVLHVPALDLVVGGDVVYGQCYQYIAENPTKEDRERWVSSLREVEKLEPKWVVPSHMRADEGYGPSHIKDTIEYIEAWDEWLGKVGDWEAIEGCAREKWPARVGSFILRYTAQSFFNATFRASWD
jgi:glyoxylase-like metal-dependent hydrolase (beta-lactamase superfamily II)